MEETSVPIVEEQIPIVEEQIPIVQEPLIRLDDLLSVQDVLLEKQRRDVMVLDSISNPEPNQLRLRMTDWALHGFPQFYELFSISITPPTLCSDAIQRDLYDYIVFVSSKTLNQHIDLLRIRLPDFKIDYEYTGSFIRMLVSRG